MDVLFVEPDFVSEGDVDAWCARIDAAHAARLALIAKPFPPIGGGRQLTTTYPWAGVIKGDTFFGNDQPLIRADLVLGNGFNIVGAAEAGCTDVG